MATISSRSKRDAADGQDGTSAHTFVRVDKETFYRFIERHPESRYEYVRGRIMQQMTGGTKSHMRVAGRFVEVIGRQLDEPEWLVLEGRGVETAETVRHGDVVLEKLDEAGDDSLATHRPYLIAEVLSRWSEDRDLDVKPGEYTSLETLHAYIVAAQYEAACLVYLRGSDGHFPAEPARLIGLDKTIIIPALSLSIPLAEVYRGIAAPGTSNGNGADNQN